MQTTLSYCLLFCYDLGISSLLLLSKLVGLGYWDFVLSNMPMVSTLALGDLQHLG
jgi:hypothetical protein